MTKQYEGEFYKLPEEKKKEINKLHRVYIKETARLRKEKTKELIQIWNEDGVPAHQEFKRIGNPLSSERAVLK